MGGVTDKINQRGDEGMTRREFIKLSTIELSALALNLNRPSPVELGSFENNHIYRTAEGLIPAIDYQVSSGDSITRIADRYNTQASLIITANKLTDPDRIYPHQWLKIPKYPKEPMLFILESKVIRHIIQPEATTYSISRLYGVPELPVVVSTFARFGRRRGLPAGETLTLHAMKPTHIVPLDYQPADDRSLSFDAVNSLVQRVANVFSYYLGGPDGLSYLVSQGIQMGKGSSGFIPPNHIDLNLQDTVQEGIILGQSAHEMWHEVPFPWWSAGVDEGTAEWVSIEWVVGTRRLNQLFASSTQWNQEGYYDFVNTPQLRERTFNAEQYDFENRTLAYEAWRRIEERYPGVTAYLTNTWAKTDEGKRGSHDATPISIVSQLVKDDFGEEAWTFIENQHILFAL